MKIAAFQSQRHFNGDAKTAMPNLPMHLSIVLDTTSKTEVSKTPVLVSFG